MVYKREIMRYDRGDFLETECSPMKRSTKWLVRTAASLALLVAVQAVTKAAGQLITGSCVNLILAVSAGVLGFSGAAVVAVVSPFLAFLLGIGPQFLLMIPGIALGNLVYVALIVWLSGMLEKKFGKFAMFSAVLAAAAVKCLTLYAVVVKLIIPALGAPEQVMAKMTAMFSLPQLYTALIGGCIAALIVPVIRKAVKN